ncbi:MAG: tRNA lysidine(34) synthetase TilS [candidate division Zixibacteria bacterium]|nr:tRNA lysidine(34) synthetase TilS [candidate division Zixibacteria bacterium]
MEILRKFEQTIRRFNMLQKGDRVIVACSGGPDSVALLHLLNQIKEKYDLKLFVAHINHKLRGQESDEDERFVKRLAKDLGLDFYSKSFDVKKIAKKEKLSIEEAAREVRYDYLNKLANRIKATKIALGHNADDQAETVLMRLIRGAGGLGLSGMPPVKDKLIRPLLEIKREKIEQFLKENELGFRIDSSNLRKVYLRNKVRLELMPYLKKNYNPNIVDTLNRTASILSAQEDYLKKETLKAFDKIAKAQKEKISLDLAKLFNYDIFLQREILRLVFERLGEGEFKGSFAQVELVLNLAQQRKAGRRIFLKKDVLAEVSAGHLNFYKVKKEEKDQSLVFPGAAESERFGIRLDSEVIKRKNLKEKPYLKDEMTAFLSWDKLKPPFILRNPRTGDRFSPLGMKGTKSLKDFLTDLKVPRYEKERVLVLTSNDWIVWVLGYRIADQFKVQKNTKEILRIKAELTMSPKE